MKKETGDRRRFLKQVAAAGVTAGMPALPQAAQETPTQSSATPGGGNVTLAETLARYAIGLNYEDLPEDVIRIAKRSILDSVGCAFGGYASQPAKIAINLAKDVRAKHGATVLLTGTKTSPDLAVFANGVLIRYLDFNDGFVSFTHGAGHPLYLPPDA